MQIVPRTEELTPKLAALLATDRPIPVRMWAVLDGLIDGWIVVDDAASPRVVLVQELVEGTTYIGGVATREAIADAFALLNSMQEVVVCLWPDDALYDVLPAAPAYDGVAIDCTDRSPAVDLELLGLVPDGYRLHQIDAEIVPRLAGFDYYVQMFGGLEQALSGTIGFCLLHDDRVVAEAVAGPLARGVAELGVGTDEAYQRRGLATVVAARAIQAAEARGYHAFWNAAQQNTGSLALARRLGFGTERAFRVLAWSGEG